MGPSASVTFLFIILTLFMARMNFPEMEQQLVEHWKKEKIFERSVNERPEDNRFVFYDGPPFATGLPHYGHIIASTMKDVIPRYATMRGFRVERRWGWDCHGLPLENLIEKELGLESKKDIEKLGVDKFNEACKASVLKYADEWKVTIERLGRWVDMENDYKTMDSSYTESIWWAFKKLYDDNLIYLGRKAMHVCPRCETTLSNFEVTLGYKDVADLSVVWKFKVVDQDDTYLLAWTTTPWSTPGTTGLSISPEHTYVKVKIGDEYVVCAKARLEFVVDNITDYVVVEEMKGSDLVGMHYEPIIQSYKDLPEVQANANAYKVYAGDYVEVTDGTGIVTINGAYGEIDMTAAEKNDLPVLIDVDMNGHYNGMVPEYANEYVKDVEQKLVDDMEAKNLVWRQEQYLHSYPHCWRCDTPLLNYATSSWFVRVTELKDRMIKHNATVNWLPEHIKDGRFGKWLEGAKDWAISRDRYWGAPLPVWLAEDGDAIVVGSAQELEDLTGEALDDLHKQFVDKVVIEKDGKKYTRVPQVLDCWFESGSMPYAQEHYPFENKEKFEAGFPAQFIAEGVDQTRGWFYTLTVLSTALFDKPAFENVIVNGMVLAEDGKKMSKRLKNYPEPGKVMEQYGADALRMYLMSSSVVRSEDLRFSEKGVDQVMKKLILTLWNVHTFYAMFADGETVPEIPQSDDVMDKWVLAYTSEIVKDVTEAMEAYELQTASRKLEELVHQVSTWYLRRSRARFKGSTEEKLAALSTLRYVLLTTVKMLAPFTPFVTERIYLDMNGPEDSVHLDMWPEVNDAYVNVDLLTHMDTLRSMVEKLLASREEAGIKVRQPLAMATVPQLSTLPEELYEVLMTEVNVKALQEGSELGLDTELTPELAAEGMYRELVRGINAQRKKQGLTINDRTGLVYQTDDALVKQVMNDFAEELQGAVRADSITEGTGELELKVNGIVVLIAFT